ncbi:MAG: hypothetical protein NC925_05025 [Candidatus Omnitrophica bacterium]|nr:hypothetical protein [Candidatus Omnitrophota bacterium]
MNEILDGFFYNIIDALVLAVSLGIFVRIIAWITSIKNWEKIKESGITLVIIWAIILIIFGVFIISGYFIPETPCSLTHI